MEYSEEVKKLAETLKSSGLAASIEDALKKAQSMLGKKEAEEKIKEEPFERGTDAAQTTLGEVKEAEESNITAESPETEELEKEEVFTNNPGNGEKQNKVDYSKEKKVDLNEVFDVNK